MGAGFHGLVEAATKYDPNRGAKFSSFAWHWVKKYIRLEFKNKHRYAVRIQAIVDDPDNVFFKDEEERQEWLATNRIPSKKDLKKLRQLSRFERLSREERKELYAEFLDTLTEQEQIIFNMRFLNREPDKDPRVWLGFIAWLRIYGGIDLLDNYQEGKRFTIKHTALYLEYLKKRKTERRLYQIGESLKDKFKKFLQSRNFLDTLSS